MTGGEFKVKPYVGAQTGYESTQTSVKHPGGTGTIKKGIPYATVIGGVKLTVLSEKKDDRSFVADMKAGAGTALTGEVKLSYNEPIYKGLGLELSAGAKGLYDLPKSTYSFYDTQTVTIKNDNISSTITANKEYTTKFNNNVVDAAIAVGPTYGGKWGKVGLYAKAGYRQQFLNATHQEPDKIVDVLGANGNSVLLKGEKVAFNGTGKFYVTPSVNAEIVLRRREKATWNLNLTGDMNGGNVGFSASF
ncbi:MAG: hypothetical protein E7Z92_05620 [Cyanobacteria bacterium SIG31]|nr:hypothetical protein [Cyanobacteria bacterium SIG31]